MKGLVKKVVIGLVFILVISGVGYGVYLFKLPEIQINLIEGQWRGLNKLDLSYNNQKYVSDEQDINLVVTENHWFSKVATTDGDESIFMLPGTDGKILYSQDNTFQDDLRVFRKEGVPQVTLESLHYDELSIGQSQFGGEEILSTKDSGIITEVISSMKAGIEVKGNVSGARYMILLRSKELNGVAYRLWVIESGDKIYLTSFTDEANCFETGPLFTKWYFDNKK